MRQDQVLGRWSLYATAATVALAAALPAHAQSTDQQTLSASGATFSKAQRSIDINLGTDVTYDSNIIGSQASQAQALRGLEKKDVVIRPRAEAIVSLPAGPFQIGLDGSFGYDFYTRNSRLNSEQIIVDANVAGGLPNCGVTVDGGYRRGQNNLRDLSIEPGDPIASSRNIQTVNRIGGTLYCGAEIGLRALGMAEYRTSRNSNPLRRYSNVNNFTYGGGVMYSSPAVGQITAFASKSKFEFTDLDPRIGFIFPDVDVFSVGGRLDRRLGAKLQFNGQVSYVKVDVDGFGKQYDGINWDIAMTLRASDQLQVTIGTAKQIDAANGFSSNFIESSIYSASVDYAFAQRLTLHLSGSHQRRDFNYLTAAIRPLSLERDNFTEFSGRIDFRRFRRLSFNLFSTYEKRTADLTVYNYDGFTVGVGARVKL